METPVPNSASTDQTLLSIENLFKIPIDAVALSGGEITLRRDLDSLVASFASKNVPIILTTNATVLNERQIRNLMLNGVSGFQISLLGSTAAIHNEIAQKRSWHKVIENIVLIRELGIDLTLVFVACPQNLHDFPNIIEIAAFVGCTTVIFNCPLTTTGAGRINGGQLIIEEEDDLLNVLCQANVIALRHELRIVIGTPYPFDSSRLESLKSVSGGIPRDRRSQRQFVMDSFGNVKACAQSSIVLGNVNADQPEFILEKLHSEPTAYELEMAECTCALYCYRGLNISALQTKDAKTTSSEFFPS